MSFFNICTLLFCVIQLFVSASTTSPWLKKQYSCFENNLDMFIMVDSTRSLRKDEYSAFKQFIADLVKRFNIGKSRVGLMQYGERSRAVIEFNFGHHKTEKSMEDNIAALMHHRANQTFTGDALRVVNQQVFNGTNDRHDADKVLLLLTDGRPQDMELALQQADELKRKKNVHFITVGAGTQAWVDTLKFDLNRLGSKPTHNHRIRFRNFEKITNKLVDDICNKNKRQPAPPHKCFQRKQDILVMIDGSKNMGRRNFIKMKKLLQSYLARVDIGHDRMHVAMIQYSFKSTIEFPLNLYKTPEDVLAAMSKVQYHGGNQSDLGKALKDADSFVFSGGQDDRAAAPDLILIFTDGNYVGKKVVEETLTKLKRKHARVVVIGVKSKKPVNQTNIDLLATDPIDVYDINTATGEMLLDDLAPMTCKVAHCTANAPVCMPESQDIMILVDGTAKIGKTSFRFAQRYLKRLVSKMTLGKEQTHIGIMQYGGEGFIKDEAKLGVDILRSAVSVALSQMTYKSDEREADLTAALKVAKEKLSNPRDPRRKSLPKTIIIISDGDVSNFRSALDMADILRNDGIRVITLSSGYYSKNPQFVSSLRLLATGPKEYYVLSNAYFNDVLKEVKKTICVTENTIPESCYRQKRNIFFLLDSSSGRNRKKFKELKVFVENIVNEFHVGPDESHIGFMQFHDLLDETSVVFNATMSRDDLIWAIRTMKYTKGKHITLGNALSVVNKKIFVENRDQHPDYEDILILITHSNIIGGQKAFDEAENLKRKAVNIICIAAGKKKNAEDLKQSLQVISSSATNVHNVDYLKLWSINKDIMSDICGLGKCPAFASTTCTPRKQDLVFVIDGSRSVGEQNFARLQRFIARLSLRMELAKDRTHVGVLQVGSARNTHFQFKLGDFVDRDDVLYMIREMEYLDDRLTYIGHGLRLIRTRVFDNEEIDRPSVPNTLVIFTDGDSHDFHTMFEEADKLKANGVRIIAVGYGTDLRMKHKRFLPTLLRLATNEKDVFVINFNDNDLVLEGRIDKISKDLVLVDCPKAHAPPVVECKQGSIDLFLLVDGSRSIGSRNFKLVKRFLKKLSSEFELGPNGTRLGLMQFSDKESLSYEFGFQAMLTNKQAKRAIKRMQYSRGRKTYTGGALKSVDHWIFNGKNGDRKDSPDVLILFTDGTAHDIDKAEYYAARLRKRNIKIIAIAAGEKSKDPALVAQLVAITGDELEVYQSSFDELTDIVDRLVDVDCIVMPPKPLEFV